MARICWFIREWHESVCEKLKIKKYLKSGRIPWIEGYEEYKKMVLRDVLNDRELLDRFLHNRDLPPQYGFRLDERVIEYPWVLTRLDFADRLLLDAGSALNYQYILDLPVLRNRTIVIYNLSPERVIRRNNISYIYGDLRQAILRSECFDEIVCISTLEHIGMNNTLMYTKEFCYDEFRPDDYEIVVREFKRLLKPSGKLLITVPSGRYEHHGWLQQFDHERIKKIIEIFGGSAFSVAYYKYLNSGWQISSADECTDCSYFDIHNRSDYEPDYLAAARCVSCIEIVK